MKFFLSQILTLLFILFLFNACQPETGKTTTPSKQILAGLRASPYGAGALFTQADYWIRSAQNMAEKLPQAKPAVIWIIGTMESTQPKPDKKNTQFSGRTLLNFPADGKQIPNVVFSETDQNEAILTRFDQAGLSVWLQVEPANADINTLVDLALNRYRHHPCIIGFGVDVEWHQWSRETPEGVAVGDAQATSWLSTIQNHKTSYRLFLKHWRSDMMPPTIRQGVMFLDDSQMFFSLEHMREEFAAWGRHFAPAEVGFQYGYSPDRPIWSQFTHPASDLAKQFNEIPNAREFYWVDFTMRELWEK